MQKPSSTLYLVAYFFFCPAMAAKPPPNAQEPEKVRCQGCEEVGHTAQNCPVYRLVPRSEDPPTVEDLEDVPVVSSPKEYYISSDNCYHDRFSYDYAAGMMLCDDCGTDLEDA